MNREAGNYWVKISAWAQDAWVVAEYTPATDGRGECWSYKGMDSDTDSSMVPSVIHEYRIPSPDEVGKIFESGDKQVWKLPAPGLVIANTIIDSGKVTDFNMNNVPYPAYGPDDKFSIDNTGKPASGYIYFGNCDKPLRQVGNAFLKDMDDLDHLNALADNSPYKIPIDGQS